LLRYLSEFEGDGDADDDWPPNEGTDQEDGQPGGQNPAGGQSSTDSPAGGQSGQSGGQSGGQSQPGGQSGGQSQPGGQSGGQSGQSSQPGGGSSADSQVGGQGTQRGGQSAQPGGQSSQPVQAGTTAAQEPPTATTQAAHGEEELDETLSGVASFVIPGLGHLLVNDQPKRGAIVFLAASAADFFIVLFSTLLTVILIGFLGFFLLPVVHVAAGYDAYNQAQKINAGEITPE
jgi:hypothetical protein